MLTSHWGSSMTNGLIPMLVRPGMRSVSGMRSMFGMRSVSGMRSVFGMRSTSGMRSVFGMRSMFGMRSTSGMRSVSGTRSVSGFSAVTDPRVLNFIGFPIFFKEIKFFIKSMDYGFQFPDGHRISVITKLMHRSSPYKQSEMYTFWLDVLSVKQEIKEERASIGSMA
ncbi:hypothetical protein WR25_16817 [Diploscapter pachys]|uniref:Uncharacterized protein n=1 Tax=Diploscapter pachys TaxID=2018661 RepID=A0A2A2LDM1_9BILA|nr:hypothetical protein WR25_16817 [Diploscapter pachys]